MKRMKLLSALLCIALLLSAQITVCAEGQGATLTVVQSEISDTSRTVEIRLDTTEAVFGGSFNLAYDPSILAIERISYGNFTCQTNLSYAPGLARVSFAAGSSGITSGVVFTIRFRPLASESCTVPIAIESATLYNAEGKSVETATVGALCPVKVNTPLSDIELLQGDLSLGIGQTTQISYRTIPENATVDRVTFSSSNTSVATVDQNGVVTANRAGSATITCSVRDGYGAIYTKRLMVYVYQMPNATVSSGHLAVGETVTLAVRLDTLETVYTSGSMNLTYDPTLLRLESASVGAMLSSCLTTINPAYSDGKARLNFLSQVGIKGSGEICHLTFTALREGECEVGIDNLRLYTEQQQEHRANVGRGVLQVGDYRLTLTPPSEPTGWREFSVPIDFSAEPGVAGGSFVVEYDPTLLRYLGYDGSSSGFTLTVNESYGVGKIKVSFASTSGKSDGTLLCLRFISRENPSETIATTIGFDGTPITLYTQSGAPITPKSIDAEFTVMPNTVTPETGDADLSGTVDTRDATLLLRYLMGASDATIVEDSLADLNRDGVVNDADMDYLMKLLAGWDPSEIES